MAGAKPADSSEKVAATSRHATLRVVNVVAGVQLVPGHVNLQALSDKYWNTECCPEQGEILKVRFKGSGALAEITQQGRVTVRGATSADEAVWIAKKCGRMVYHTHPEAQVRHVTSRMVRIYMMTAACHAGFSINLDRLQEGHPLYATYEREQFTGLRYRMPSTSTAHGQLGSHISIVIFTNGKFNIAGAKSYAELEAAYDHILSILQQYRLPAGEEQPDVRAEIRPAGCKPEAAKRPVITTGY